MNLELEIESLKQTRKSLITLSIIGLILQKLILQSTGSFKFLGFSIPIENTTFLPTYIGIGIIYLIIVFLFKLLNQFLERKFIESENKTEYTHLDPDSMWVYYWRYKRNRTVLGYWIFFNNTLLPILLSAYCLYSIFCPILNS